jgi:MFS family permease
MKIVLVLLGLSVFINYIDRSNLSIAATSLQDELGLSASQLGILLSTFFWSYSSMQLLSGWLVDRFDVNWVLALGFLLWSAATAATGLAHQFAMLLALRLILGIGESVAYPSYSKILGRHFPEDRRGFANSVIAAGLTCGPAFGMFFGGKLIARFGWRPFFIVLGLVSLSWLAPWFKWRPTEQDSIASVNGKMAAPTLLQFVKLRSAWGTCAGLFFSNYLNYFLITWMPFYLVRELHFSMNEMATIAGASYISAAVVSIACGWISDRWIDSGATPTFVRKTFTGGGLVCASVFLIACVVGGRDLSTAMIICVTASFGAASSNIWAVTQTLAGPQAAGRWTGMQNFLGNLSGIVAPSLTGLVLDRTGQFFWPFTITSIVVLLGALSWVFVVGTVEPVRWEQIYAPRVAKDSP